MPKQQIDGNLREQIQQRICTDGVFRKRRDNLCTLAEEQREEMIKNRREEREEQQKKLEEERKENKDNKAVNTVEISEDGKVLLKENIAATEGTVDGADTDGVDLDTETVPKPKADLEPVFYSSAGTVKQTEDSGTKVSASV